MTFEKILYLKKLGGGRIPEWTEFGFVSDGQSYEKVLVPGRPHINAGLSVTAWLRKKDDWRTLNGWIDNQSGDLAVGDATYHVALVIPLLLACCYFAGLAAIAAPIASMRVDFYFNATFALLMAVAAAVPLRQYWTIRSVTQQLKQARGVRSAASGTDFINTSMLRNPQPGPDTHPPDHRPS